MKKTQFEINTLHGGTFRRCGIAFTPERKTLSVAPDAPNQEHLPPHVRKPAEAADLSASQFEWLKMAARTKANQGGLLAIHVAKPAPADAKKGGK